MTITPQKLKTAFEMLTDKEYDIIMLRCIWDKHPNLKMTAKLMSTTQDRIRQVEENAIKKINSILNTQ